MNGQVDSSRKAQARELRRKGQSLRDIASQMSLSKSVVGRWLKGTSQGQQARDRLKVRRQVRDRVSHVKANGIVQAKTQTFRGHRDTHQGQGQSRKTLPGWVCLLLIGGALGFFLFEMCLKNLDKVQSEPETETGSSDASNGRPFDNLAP